MAGDNIRAEEPSRNVFAEAGFPPMGRGHLPLPDDVKGPAIRSAIETPWNLIGEELNKLDESIAALANRIHVILREEEQPSDPGLAEKRPGGGEVSELQQDMWSRVDWIRRINAGVNSIHRRVDL